MKLTGDTQNREEVVRRFQDGEVPIFLISLKAGGVGLNLTAADTVIHYDPWWNPAVENQATDRAHRLGQTKNVFVYKLVVAGSIEEKILALQEKKAELAAGILSEDAAGPGQIRRGRHPRCWPRCRLMKARADSSRKSAGRLPTNVRRSRSGLNRFVGTSVPGLCLGSIRWQVACRWRIRRS